MAIETRVAVRARNQNWWLKRELRKHLRFQGGDAFVGEAEVGAGAFESFLRGSVFPGRLLDSPFSTLFDGLK
ncbi:hypothetical protein ACH40D_22555 [Streptomyces olivaceoviridis]|uniref:hypothetical protein n=1 Tax=Streptomyces olivaceoviridis TaxID=1921 RepID=UPI00131C8D81